MSEEEGNSKGPKAAAGPMQPPHEVLKLWAAQGGAFGSKGVPPMSDGGASLKDTLARARADMDNGKLLATSSVNIAAITKLDLPPETKAEIQAAAASVKAMNSARAHTDEQAGFAAREAIRRASGKDDGQVR